MWGGFSSQSLYRAVIAMSKQRTLRECALQGTLVDCLVVDAHGHLGPVGEFDRPVSTAKETIAVMDRIGIDVLCVSHLESLRGDYRRGNDLVAEAIRNHPGRFIGYAVPNPNHPEQIEPELDRCINELGMRGIKTHIEWHNQPADNPGYWRIYEYAQAHGGLPVLGHSFGDASTAERIVRTFADVPFIHAHVAGGLQNGFLPTDKIRLAGAHDNFYIDLVSTLVPFGTLEILVKEVGAKKLLFGSDLCFQQATHQIGTVLLADISEEDKKLILGQNAARIFGFDPSGKSYDRTGETGPFKSRDPGEV